MTKECESSFMHGLQVFYNENKTVMKCYVFIALLISVWVAFPWTQFNLSSVKSAGTLRDINVVEYGGSGGMAIQSAAETLDLAIDPPILLGLCAGASILQENGIWLEGVPTIPFGIMDYWWARILTFVWLLVYIGSVFIGGKLEEISSKYVGPACLLLFGFATIVSADWGCNVCYAATDIYPMTVSTLSFGNVMLAVATFFQFIAMYAAYALIRIFIFGVDVITSIIGKLQPGFRIGFGGIKGLLLVGFYRLSEKSPVLFIIFGIIILVVAAFISRWAFNTIRFFREIYMVPFFHRLFGKNGNQSLIPKKVPRKIGTAITNMNIVALIPVYTMKELPGFHVREKWWLAITPTESFILRGGVFSKEIQSYPFSQNGMINPRFLANMPNGSSVMFLRQAKLLRGDYCELFTLFDIRKRPLKSNKVYQFVFSREYMNQYAAIQNLLRFPDYDIAMQAQQANGVASGFGKSIQNMFQKIK